MIVLWILCGIIGLLLLLLLIAVIHTLLIPSLKSTYVPNPDPDRALTYGKTLARMVQYDTVSIPDTDQR